MDQEMGEAFDFLSLEEIDLDYEYDASRYFDLSREELPSEAWEAELWFETAASYPPSPLIAKMNIGEDIYAENVNTLPKFKDTENINYTSSLSDGVAGTEFSTEDKSYKGWTFRSIMSQDVQKDKKKINKGFSKGSTLMKPTASQLAKQNRPREVKYANRFVHRVPKSILQISAQNVEDEPEHLVQATKRQKLEGGLSRKVVGVNQQTDFMHKVPEKKIGSDCNFQFPRLRLTIPREPELETAQRAQRLRAQRLRSNDGNQSQAGGMPTTSSFKARPLNRKIFEAPSLPLRQKSTPQLPKFQMFNLKTEERAAQHASTASTSLIAKNEIPNSAVQDLAPASKTFENQPVDPSELQNDDRKQDEHRNILPKFKALPLNKKILSSKGDIGIFRSTKQEITIPMEFHFSTSKRCRQDPPTELFNKLSLNSDARLTSASHTKLGSSSKGVTKGSKENMIVSEQLGHKEEVQKPGIKQIGIASGLFSKNGSRATKFRSLGIR
ncbi:protein TPX2 isoform X2 [Phoenix dactylifera]|uniref:Protein TPX2 isoform X2 n=1 Tax=Phoenix dactylifera TaxID=42345 RepID=A0A8B7MSR3_PHODC|nr:protein TPX2 isoform X2 [Phoenix dactylifera]